MRYDLITLNGPVFVDPNAGIVKTTGGTAVLQIDASMVRGGDEPYHPELQYLALLQELVDKSDAAPREDRTGTGTFSVFGRQMRFDLAAGFPLLTTKKIFTNSVFGELAWFLRGETNVKLLNDWGVHIWDANADENGDLGPVYGKQWRAWPDPHNRVERDLGVGLTSSAPGVIDQIADVIFGLKANPSSRRHIVSAWNVAEVEQMRLPPCHLLFQFYVDDGKLSCQLYQRSADIFLGVPFNVASYAALVHLIARETGLEVGEFIHTFGDLHLYANHVEQAKEQLSRTPRPFPTLTIAEGADLDRLTPDDFLVDGYDPHPAIKAEMSV